MKEENPKTKRYKFHIIICVFIIIFCIGIAPKALQNDTFYTIKVGEYVAQNGIGNLTQDPFSWHELPYTFPHWLYDLMIYTIYSIGGMAGIYGSTIFFTIIIGISIYFTSNKISKNAPVSAIITFVALYLLKPYIAARAQIVTFSFMVLTLYLIEKYLENAKKRYAFGLIAFSILIVNLHMAVWPFFFVLFVPYLVEYFISRDIITFDIILKLKIRFEKITKNREERLKKLYNGIEDNKKKRAKIKENPYKIKVTRNDNVKKLFIVMIICACMGIFTPTGTTTPYTYLYKTMTGNTMQIINEHKPIDLSANQDFVAFFVAFIVILTFIDVKIDIKHLFYYLGILYLSLNSRRQVSMFLIICTPILVKLIADVFDKYSPKTQNIIINIVTSFYGKVILGTLVIVITIRNAKPILQEEYYTNQNYPIYACEWIKENIPDYKNIKLFNEYNYGSYLIFQGIPVMIDSRCDLYTPQYNTKTGDAKDGQDIFMEVQNIATDTDDYKDTFEKYGITHAITYKNSNLDKKIKLSSNYQRIYPLTEDERKKDNRFVIYEKISEKVKQ